MSRQAAVAVKLNRRISLEEAMANPRLLRGLKKECFTCDPYNPVAGPREGCPTCGGTGLQDFEAVAIVNDLKKNRRKAETYYDEDE